MTRLYPINVLMKARKVLIVGGGKVAARKLSRLLNCGAQVKVVAGKFHDRIVDMAERHPELQLEQRYFEEGDLEGVFFCFAATNDSEINAAIIELCGRRGILSSAVDRNWEDGDFICPANFHYNDLSFTVSTGGEACRKTKTIADSLSRRIHTVENAELLVMGTDQNWLPLDKREEVHLTPEKAAIVGKRLQQVWGIHEFILLNTCNRLELIAVACPTEALVDMCSFILGLDKLESDEFYVKEGLDAFAHVCEVNAGLLSQTPGEKHITAQLKEAYNIGKENGWCANLIDQWLSWTRHISRQIRQEVEPILRTFEIEELALEYVGSEVEQLADKKVLVIGAGMVGNDLVARLKKQNVAVCQVYRNTLPADADVEAVQLEKLSEVIGTADVVIAATSSPEPVVTVEHSRLLKESCVLVDLCVPRNISPELKDCVEKMADMEDLKHWHRRFTCDREQIDRLSQNIISNHHHLYEKIMYTFQGRNQG